MGNDAQNSVSLSDEAQKKFDENVAALTAMRSLGGPPRDTTFAEIEDFGHEVGRMLSTRQADRNQLIHNGGS